MSEFSDNRETILRFIKRDNAIGGITVGELCKETFLSSTSVQRHLDHLMYDGIVKRVRMGSGYFYKFGKQTTPIRGQRGGVKQEPRAKPVDRQVASRVTGKHSIFVDFTPPRSY